MLIVEVAIFLWGAYGLILGKLPITKTGTVRGPSARWLGLIAMMPIPLALVVGTLIGIIIAPLNLDQATINILFAPIDLILIVVTLGITLTLGKKLAERDDEAEARLAGVPAPAPAPAPKPASIDDEDWAPAIGAVVPRRWGRLIALLGVFFGILLTIGLIPILSPKKAEEPNGFAAPPIVQADPKAAAPPFVAANPSAPTVPPPTPARPPAPNPPAIASNSSPTTPPAARVPAPERKRPKGPADPIEGPIVGEPEDARDLAAPRGPAGFDAPASPGRSLAGKVRKLPSIAYADLRVDAKGLLPCVNWSPDGKAFFLLDRDGTLRKVQADGLREVLSADAGATCSWLSTSGEGLVVSVGSTGEVRVVDPDTFAVKARIRVGQVDRAVAGPSASVALASVDNGERLAVVDLKLGKVLARYGSRSFPGQVVGFKHLAASPDGKAFFAEGMERLLRFTVGEGGEVTLDQGSSRIAQNGRSIDVSPDGSRVALPSGGGNYDQPAPYTTAVYAADRLDEPIARVSSGAYPQAVGFDPKSKAIYAQDRETPLMIYNEGGAKPRKIKIGPSNDPPLQFAVHPDGGKLVSVSKKAIFYVEVVDRDAPDDAGPSNLAGIAADADSPKNPDADADSPRNSDADADANEKPKAAPRPTPSTKKSRPAARSASTGRTSNGTD